MLPLVAETWTWFTVVMLIAICRFISRILALGSIRKLQADDLLMIFVLCTYTTVIVTINIVANADTNLFPSGFDLSSLTAQDKRNREFGSKLVLVVEQCQIHTTWGAKACILIMYSRLTAGRPEHIAFKALAAYVAFGYVFMEIFYFGVWCRPFHEYWAVPTSSEQCNAAINHLITNAVFNLSSDTILLAIALPMFIRSKLPQRKKIALTCVFSLGIFVILCAILNKYYSFTEPFGSMWTFWYVRESSTSLLVTNLPFMWTLLRRVLPFKALESTVENGYGSTRGYGSTHPSRMRKGSDLPTFHARTDPEMGCKLPESDTNSNTPVNEDPFFDFITIPQSITPCTTESLDGLDTSPLGGLSKCVVRDSISERRRSQTFFKPII